jgi:hypothetical protein
MWYKATYVDKGYRSHNTANPHRVFISGQKRGVFGLIKRELLRSVRLTDHLRGVENLAWPESASNKTSRSIHP